MVKIFRYINLESKNVDYTKKRVIIYGRGVASIRAIMELKGLGANVIGVVDSFSKNEGFFAGIKVISFASIEDKDDLVIYIAVNNEEYKRDILYKLESKNFKKTTVVCKGVIYGAWEYNLDKMTDLINKSQEKINFILQNLADEQSNKVFSNLISYRRTNDHRLLEDIYETGHKQYFPQNDFWKIEKDEVFIDAGGFDGLSTIDFAEWTKGQYKKSIILEADDFMYKICKEMIRIHALERVELIKKAVYSGSTTLCFDNSNCLSGSGNISDSGIEKIESISIDELNTESAITFIKMDIEGAEMEALIGAEKTIEKNHPKLAISIYHKADDLWEIPYYLMKKYPFYKFYMRHYTPYTTETIIYATE
ncbi:MAG: FkbM family methyltransferase [Agathobacter sp.]|uniref:FkbM family methyltransferase n=1 Tax=Agathobacter sp. TaxID=2021311 RepID=UPI0025837DBC|nr:FkbM family methyltransferase [Agathobacter sp.]MCR5678131.1 FkbM family methyltransferase [Agathobacter sp.]